jgi:hypothetical protein
MGRWELAWNPATFDVRLSLREERARRHAHHRVNRIREGMGGGRKLLPCRRSVLRLGRRRCPRNSLVRGHILIEGLGLVDGDESSLFVLDESGRLEGRLTTGIRRVYVGGVRRVGYVSLSNGYNSE